MKKCPQENRLSHRVDLPDLRPRSQQFKRSYSGPERRARNEYERIVELNGEELPAELHAHLQAVEHLLRLVAERSPHGS